ncbi:MAG: hypothetical protein Crog4KO_22070 [Crocinitomicaceae bacterium]
MKLICTSLLLVLSNALFAQQESVPGQFWNNQTHSNPAFAGLEHQLQGGAFYRDQWENVSGSPFNLYGFFNTRFGGDFGTGLNVDYGTIGFNENLNISVPISYRLQINTKNTLAFGAALGYGSVKTEGLFIPPTPGEDPFLFEGKQELLLGQAGMAFDNKWITASISARTIELAKFNDSGNFDYEPHFYSMIRGKLPFGSYAGLLQNSMAMLDVLHSYQNGFQRLQLTARVQFRQRLTLFAGIINRSSYIVGGGWDFLQKLRATYSIEITNSPLTNTSNPTHEFSLVYQLPISR